MKRLSDVCNSSEEKPTGNSAEGSSPHRKGNQLGWTGNTFQSEQGAGSSLELGKDLLSTPVIQEPSHWPFRGSPFYPSRAAFLNRGAPVLRLVPKRTLCATCLQHSIPRKATDGSKRKKIRLAKLTSFHFLQRNIRPQNCQPSAGPKALTNRPRTGSENKHSPD